MAATKEDVDRWIREGIQKGHKYIVSVCDTFDWDDYPVFCKDEDERDRQKKSHDRVNMQKVNEVIDLDDYEVLESGEVRRK